MRLTTIPKAVLLGAAGAYVVHRVRRGTFDSAISGRVPPPDPRDPVQSLYSETDPAIDAEPLETLETPETPMYRDDDQAMEDGQNWLESLATDSVEGIVPERELDLDGDETIGRAHPAEPSDTPVADRGSGGPSDA